MLWPRDQVITKLHIPSITWLREFAWQMNFIISLLPRGLLLLSLTRWWLVMRSLYSHKCLVIWSRDHSSHVMNQKHFIFNPTKFMDTKPDRVVTYDMKPPPTKSHQPSITLSNEVTKPDMLLAFDRFDKWKPSTKSHDFLIKWSLMTNSRDK